MEIIFFSIIDVLFMKFNCSKILQKNLFLMFLKYKNRKSNKSYLSNINSSFLKVLFKKSLQTKKHQIIRMY